MMSHIQLFSSKLHDLLLRNRDISQQRPYELEIRVGRFIRNRAGELRFDTNLGKENYLLIKTYLNSCQWQQIEETEFDEYKHKTLRVRVMKNKDKEIIRKKPHTRLDLLVAHHPNALRLSMSEEIEETNHPTIDSQWNKVSKNRTTYYARFFRIDATQTTKLGHHSYQVEIELDNSAYSDNESTIVAETIETQTIQILSILQSFNGKTPHFTIM